MESSSSVGWIEGPVRLFGDDVNTDVLHPSRFYSLDSVRVEQGLKREPSATEEAATIWVAGRNFGYGSSRETTMQAVVAAGVKAVVASSISRIFWRNALNYGIAVLEIGDIHRKVNEGERLRIHPGTGVVLANDARYQGTALDDYEFELWQSGGMLGWMQQT